MGFNVDSAFGESIDCLIKVDLRETEPRALAKYMGAEGAAAFRRHHGSAAHVALSRDAG